MSKTLQSYLAGALASGLIDHSVRANQAPDGKVTFYIHPAGADGETLDFVVRGNSMVPSLTNESGERCLTFGQAIEALKDGKRVARAGWNGKGMWIAMTPGSEFSPEFAKPGHAAAHLARQNPGEPIRLGAHIDMKSADGTLVIGWLASQTDMLAEDWLLLEDVAEVAAE